MEAVLGNSERRSDSGRDAFMSQLQIPASSVELTSDFSRTGVLSLLASPGFKRTVSESAWVVPR